MLLGVLGWIGLGVLVGFIVSKSINLRGDDPRIGIAIAAVAAIVGGVLYSMISGSPVSGFNFWSLICAAIAAGAAMAAWHILRHRSPYARPTIRRSY
jgi:uncharacterized membrane protein YeaQ/YmgE (transglycosylase-associated protein family)